MLDREADRRRHRVDGGAESAANRARPADDDAPQVATASPASLRKEPLHPRPEPAKRPTYRLFRRVSRLPAAAAPEPLEPRGHLMPMMRAERAFRPGSYLDRKRPRQAAGISLAPRDQPLQDLHSGNVYPQSSPFLRNRCLPTNREAKSQYGFLVLRQLCGAARYPG